MAELCGQSIILVEADSLKALDALEAWADEENRSPNSDGKYRMTIDELTSIADPKHISYDDFVMLTERHEHLDAEDIEDAYYYDPDDPYGDNELQYYEDDEFEEFI